MSEPKVAGILMIITGAFLLIPAVLLGIASIFIVPLPTLPSVIIWVLTIIIFVLAALNLSVGVLLMVRGNEHEVRTLGLVVAILNLALTWWSVVGAIFAALELAFLI